MILTDEERAELAHEMVKGCKSVNWLASRLEAEVLRKLRERPADAYLIDWPDEPDLGNYFSEEPSGCGRSRPLHIIPEEHE